MKLEKPRSDSWYADLSDEQLWQLWEVAQREPWFRVKAYAEKEMGVTRNISHGGFYRWKTWMCEQESEHRLYEARVATMEIDELAAKVGLEDEKAIAAYKSLAAEAALRTGSAKQAAKFIEMATAIQDRILHTKELALKERAQGTKDEQLKLAREKFEAAEKRLAAVQGAVDDAKLTDAERVAQIKTIFGMK